MYGHFTTQIPLILPCKGFVCPLAVGNAELQKGTASITEDSSFYSLSNYKSKFLNLCNHLIDNTIFLRFLSTHKVISIGILLDPLQCLPCTINENLIEFIT